MWRLPSILLLMLTVSGCATRPEPTIWTAGIADTVSTELALSQGAVELNPAGYPGVILVKLAATVYVENIQDCERRILYDRTITSLSLGATANNLLVYLAAWTPALGLVALATSTKLVWDYRLGQDQNACESLLGPAAAD